MSNAADSSFGVPLVVPGTQSTFDVRNESDVIELLHLLHLNPVDQETKNHLRDLIFAYRQKNGEAEGRKIQEQLAPLGVTIVYADIKNTDLSSNSRKKTNSLGNTRPQPRFESTRSAPSAVAVEKKIEQPEVSPAISDVSSKNTEAAAPIVPVSAPEVKAPIVVGEPSAGVSERIKEIKRLVNEKVGNPVNLIEADNDIGREYMNALLDAMKKSNGAPAGELHVAMDRLELAFKHVEEIIFPKVGSASQVVRVPETPLREEKQAVPKAEAKTPQMDLPIQQKPTVQSVEPEPEHQIPLSVASEFRPPEGSVRMSSVKENLAAAIQPEEAPMPQQPAPLLHSVAKEKQLQDLLRTNRESEVQSRQKAEEEKVTQVDPLYAPEVTAGLNQLLSEWSLFKSSGILGTGPKGKDHPLYKKLHTLTMAGVISGRFEGANASVKQSITDYMNGWRYEEGVAHDHGETFEHYLRRVVRHILNRKQAK